MGDNNKGWQTDKEIVQNASDGTPDALHAHFTRTIKKIEKHLGELKRYASLMKKTAKRK